MMEYINTWLRSNIKSNDEKLLNYTNEAYMNTPPQTSVIPRGFIQKYSQIQNHCYPLNRQM
jgi:hypothetical protein